MSKLASYICLTTVYVKAPHPCFNREFFIFTVQQTRMNIWIVLTLYLTYCKSAIFDIIALKLLNKYTLKHITNDIGHHVYLVLQEMHLKYFYILY